MLEKVSRIHKTYLLDQQQFCWRHFSITEVVQNTDLNILALQQTYSKNKPTLDKSLFHFQFTAKEVSFSWKLKSLKKFSVLVKIAW